MDNRHRMLVTVMLAALLIGAPASGSANDSAMGGSGGAVAPIGSTTIRMVAETVQVVIYRQFAEYRVDFEFENSGAPQTVKLGFPFLVPAEGDYQPPAAFRAWRGDTPLEVTYQTTDNKDGTVTGYYLHDAAFPAGTTRIRVSYFAYHDSWASQPPASATPPAPYKDGHSFWGSFPYQVSSGAGWAGTIGTSVIRYYVSPDAMLWGIDEAIAEQARLMGEQPEAPSDAAKVLGSYRKPAPDVYEWVFKDYEPTPDANRRSAYDIELPFFIPYGDSEFALPWMPYAKVAATSELALDGYEYPAVQAVDGMPSTAWAESVKGSGVGESITVTFPQRRAISEVRVLPGYAKRDELFRKYNRPKSLGLEFSDGTATSLGIADENTLQRFPVSANAEWVKVTIKDVYKGTTRDETYLSEIEFGTPAPDFLPFEDVLAGRLTAGSGEPADRPQPDGNGEDRTPGNLPDWIAAPGWPQFWACGGCAMVLALTIIAVLVTLQRRAARRRASTGGPQGAV